MSLNPQPSCENASQLLNFNMENISVELGSMLIGGELDGLGAIGTNDMPLKATSYGECGVAHVNNNTVINETNYGIAETAPAPRITPTLTTKEAHMLQLYRQYYYQQQLQHQQLLQQQHQQKIIQQRQINSVLTLYSAGPTPSAVAATHLKSMVPHGMNINMNNNYVTIAPPTKQVQYCSRTSACSGTGSVSTKHSTSPKFEFHFLRCQSSNKLYPETNNVPLISSAARNECETEYHCGFGRRGNRDGGGNGAANGQRRVSRQTNLAKEEEIDYDKIVVDLSLLGLSFDNKEHNPVLRLFGLFRQMHFYLNEVLPAGGHVNDSTLTTDNVPAKCSMPCTMNVQYQVRQAARKCTIFLCDMQRILDSNKMHSRELYMECEQSLNILRKLLTQFEVFKRMEMEHKRGQFVTEEARVQTQKLEKIVEELNDQIRETHIYVNAFNWAVERSKRSMLYNVVNETHEFKATASERVANEAAATNAMALTCVDTLTTTTMADTTKSGISAQFVSYNEALACSAGVVTLIDNETEADRQSTRYIGYK